jgi:hypothetical protein
MRSEVHATDEAKWLDPHIDVSWNHRLRRWLKASLAQ